MIPATTFKGKMVALFGLGGSGLVTAKALMAGGADVTAWDDNEKSVANARAEGVPCHDLRQADWSQFASFVLSPGVPLTHPEPHWTVKIAKAHGVEIIGDIEIFCRERRLLKQKTPFVAITGTNGKSTTTALIAHLYRTLGFQVEMGGNIGVPVLALAPPAPERVHVIELSTFQIDLTPTLDPYIGVLLNLTPDHIDRHGTMERYAAIKERMVAQSDIAVIALDDPYTFAIAERLRKAGKPGTSVSMNNPAISDGVTIDGSRLVRKVAGRAMTIADLAGIASLRGKHNAQNAAAAVAALGAHGFNHELVQKGLSTFPGLAHRMEQVGKRGRVLFVNDSKATNADAAEKALMSFRDIYWIAGGKAKEGGIAPLKPLFDRIAKAYLIGAATDDFARTLDGLVAYERCGTIDNAVVAAARDAAASAAPEPVVLLSPACASYDQFANFEQRGEAFRAAVAALPGA
ncbi:MAG: UDP-N-acetylmuramoyl-L-alanine--D-glutamate ligase [Hyphomicrobiales bacterium]|nr:UDP-N-acetylmuramoyl-L-alanine--D-glutamate ligase [Hyphomicrobiales bacterium]